MHDFLTVGAAAPLQEAGVTALHLPEEYYRGLAAEYLARRDRMLAVLEGTGFSCYKPRGAYYIMADISSFGFASDIEFTEYLIKAIGVAVVPGSSFYSDAAFGRQQVRFAFSKTAATLDEAAKRSDGRPMELWCRAEVVRRFLRKPATRVRWRPARPLDFL